MSVWRWSNRQMRKISRRKRFLFKPAVTYPAGLHMEAAERVAERVVVELLDSDSDEDNLYDTDEERGTLRDEHATIDLSLDDDELEELGDELEELGQRAEESRKALYAAAKRHHQRGSLNAQPNRKRARASPAGRP